MSSSDKVSASSDKVSVRTPPSRSYAALLREDRGDFRNAKVMVRRAKAIDPAHPWLVANANVYLSYHPSRDPLLKGARQSQNAAHQATGGHGALLPQQQRLSQAFDPSATGGTLEQQQAEYEAMVQGMQVHAQPDFDPQAQPLPVAEVVGSAVQGQLPQQQQQQQWAMGQQAPAQTPWRSGGGQGGTAAQTPQTLTTPSGYTASTVYGAGPAAAQAQAQQWQGGYGGSRA
jgi:hypothetical protein